MATTLATLTPYSAEFPTSNAPALDVVNTRPVLAFDASTDETAYWTLRAPQGLSGTLSLVVDYMMASATSGAVGLQATVEAITDADAVDLDATSSFDSANNSASTTVPGTAGHIDQIAITLSNADSIAAGDYVRIAINRDANGSAITDDATGDLYLLLAELRTSA